MDIQIFNRYIKIVFLVFIAVFSLSSYGTEQTETLLVDGTENGTQLQGPIKYLLDEQSSFTAKQAWENEKSFKESNIENSWLGTISGSVWNKFIFKNDGDSSIVIHIEYPYYQPSTIVLYQRLMGSKEGFQATKNSLLDSASDRSIAFPRVALPIEIAPQESIEVLLETFSDVATPRFAEFRIWSTKSIVQASNIEHMVFAVVVSFIIFSAIFSLFLLNFMKERFFLWYSLFALSSLPVLGLTTGILNLYIPNFDYHPLGTISMIVMMAAGIQFIRAYSNASFHSLIADKVMHLSLVLVLIALPIAIIGFHELAMQIQQLAIFTFPAAIIAAIYCGSLGEKKITTMVLAKLLFFIILLSTNVQTWGWVSPSYGLVFLPTMGMLAQLICLIWAMYGKAKTHYKDGSTEDLDIITTAYEKAYELQEQVKQQNQMLKAAKEQAEFEARTDMLTQLPNRRAFMNLAKMAIAQAERQNKPLTFIMFDIDNFKSINDQYGHPAGDYTLKEVSDITRSIVRASDFCGRIGGEEFMIGCHASSIDDAFNLAERIRKAIEACEIKFDNLKFSTTISLGLAQVEEGDTLELVTKKADAAMYLSKTNGKNKVTHHAA